MPIEYPPGCQPVQLNLSPSELVKRLKTLSEALSTSDTNQDAGIPDRYRSLTLHLARTSFFDHGSRDVRLQLACCLADLLRIFAPESPIGNPQDLKNLLLFLVKTLGGLDTSQDDPLYRRYYYLLENLYTMKSLHLALELGDDAQLIIRTFIKETFKAVKPTTELVDGDTKVQGFLMDIATQLINRVVQISNPVLDAIFYFIVNPQKADNRESYRMARNLLQRCQTTFEPCIQLFLNQALLSDEMPEFTLLNRSKLYDVIFALNEILPDVLYSVLPRLENKLKVEDDKERMSAVKLVGQLCYWPKSRVTELVPALWSAYMGRFKDRNKEIRTKCVESCEQFMQHHQPLRPQITEALIERSRDQEEMVRMAAVKTIMNCARKKFGCVSEALLECVVERTRDRKFNIRKEAILDLATLYRKVLTNTDYTDSERASLKLLQQKLLLLYYQHTPEDKALVEKVLVTCLVPFTLDAEKRMAALLALYCHLDMNSAKAFDEIIRRQNRLRHQIEEVRLVVCDDKLKDEDREAELRKALRQVVEQLLEPGKAEGPLLNFFCKVISTDKRANDRLAYMCSNDYTTAKIQEATVELCEKIKSAGFNTDAYNTIKSLLERTAPLMIDADAAYFLCSQVLQLVDRSNFKETSAMRGLERALRVLKLIGEQYAPMFGREDTVKVLIEMLQNENVQAVEVAILLLTNIIEKSKSEKLERLWSSLPPILENIVITGACRPAKYAIRCIGRLIGSVEERLPILRRIFEASIANVDLTNDQCQTALIALSAIITLEPAEFRGELREFIRATVVSKIVLSIVTGDAQPAKRKNRDDDDEYEENDEEEDAQKMDADLTWLPEERLPTQTRAKLAGMKLMTRYLCAVANDGGDILLEKTLHMFATMIDAKGDLHGSDKISEWEKGHLRVAAGCCILKLAEMRPYAAQISLSQFQSSATLMADPLDDVRQRYALRLHKGLTLMRLSIEYMGQLAMAGLVKNDKEYLKNIQSSIVHNIVKRRELIRKRPELQQNLPYHLPEYCLAYAVHLLAHYKHYVKYNDVAMLRNLRDCLWVLLSVFAQKPKDPKERVDPHGQNNVPFIYHLFQEVKNSTDHQIANCESPRLKAEQNKKLWTIADIGITLLNYRVAQITKDAKVKAILSNRFFDKPTNLRKGNLAVYVPRAIIDEEKRKHSKGARFD